MRPKRQKSAENESLPTDYGMPRSNYNKECRLLRNESLLGKRPSADRIAGISVGPRSAMTALAMIFKFAEAAEKSWRRLDGHNQLPKVILGVKFADGVEVIRSQAQAAAA
jgi:hypothetical protein